MLKNYMLKLCAVKFPIKLVSFFTSSLNEKNKWIIALRFIVKIIHNKRKYIFCLKLIIDTVFVISAWFSYLIRKDPLQQLDM